MQLPESFQKANTKVLGTDLKDPLTKNKLSIQCILFLPWQPPVSWSASGAQHPAPPGNAHIAPGNVREKPGTSSTQLTVNYTKTCLLYFTGTKTEGSQVLMRLLAHKAKNPRKPPKTSTEGIITRRFNFLTTVYPIEPNYSSTRP